MRSNLNELLSVLQEIREKEHPEIPAEVIEQIVSVQYDNQDEDDRPIARNSTMAIIAKFINADNSGSEG